RGRSGEWDAPLEGGVPEPGRQARSGAIRGREAGPLRGAGRDRRAVARGLDRAAGILRLHREPRLHHLHATRPGRPHRGRAHRRVERAQAGRVGRDRWTAQALARRQSGHQEAECAGGGRGRRASRGARGPMNLSSIFIQRPVMTTLVMIGILIFGIIGYTQLPVSDLPNVDYPVISVSANLPGASPETMASAVATPLEKQFTTIAGIESMTSTSTQGS